MRALVTGATGFVGSAVARALLAAQHEVRALVRAGSDPRNLEGLQVDIVQGDLGDLRDAPSLERALQGCEVLFHVAADYRLWARRPEELYETNVEGTDRLMRAALRQRIDRVVYTSSVAVLGLRDDDLPADEETPVQLSDMIGDYKRSKFLAEERVRQMVERQGLPAVIVNPSTPVGPRDIKPTPTGRILVEAARGRMPAFVETGLNLVHVDDVATGHLLALERGVVGERYVLGGQNMRLKDLLAQVAHAVGRPAPRVRIPQAVALPAAYVAQGLARLGVIDDPFVTVDGVRMSRKKMYFSSAKAEQELGYTARPAEDAIRDAVRWFGREGYLA